MIKIVRPTKRTPKEKTDLVSKTNSLNVEGLIIKIVQPTKRTPKEKTMEDEYFDKIIYQRSKKCGFVTERPMFWAYAVESYVRSEEGVFGKCFYKSQKDAVKYMELKVILFFHYTNQIELNINFILKSSHY